MRNVADRTQSLLILGIFCFSQVIYIAISTVKLNVWTERYNHIKSESTR